jgi:UDP-N-acetylmuramoyl-tripeptide--D-alanyl-D-alanine ligase
MDARPLKFVAESCDGNLLHGSPETSVRRVCTDSRQARPGDLFFALSGDKFDGHDFVQDAVKAGAAAVVVSQEKAPAHLTDCAILAVGDTRKALGRLASEYRKEFQAPILAVGGSNGKTTTKELVASVIKQKLPVVWSEASFNNDIGVPLTLLKLEKSHKAAVVEVGTNHPGELAPLVRMIQPSHAVITNIGREHLEFFGDLAGVAAEEGWLAELLPADGKLFVNGDDEWSQRITQRTRATVSRIGFSEGNDWRACNLKVDKEGTTFSVEGPRADFIGEYRVGLLGRHQVLNALFAIASGQEMDLNPAEVRRGLAECKPARMRMQFSELNGVRIIDDSYNANADSMIAALRALSEWPGKGRRVAVLGDMAEQGEHGEAAHEQIGRCVAELGIAQLFAVGRMAPVLARGAREAGLNRILEFADVEAAGAALKSFVRSGDMVLVKASRVMRLERVVEILRAGELVTRD